MIENLAGIEPELLWKHFDDVRKIPRCSKHEEKIREHIRNFAKTQELDWSEDEVGNIVIRKTATAGYENAPTVVLQSHVDMVCEKNAETVHDFSKDAIKLDIRDGWLHAVGTSLGADDGIGVATAMGILEANNLKHGPLEALFTIDEETGLTGAFALKPDFLKGRIMLNLDSEEWGTIYVGCAGGGDTKLSKKYDVQMPPQGYSLHKLSVKGLSGGHSGVDVHEQRANAVKLLARMLYRLHKKTGIQLAKISGGDKHNAIPREASAVFYAPSEKRGDVKTLVSNLGSSMFNEYKYREPGMKTILEETSAGGSPLSSADTKEIVTLLLNIPHGVLKMNYEIPELVETSSNLASIKLQNGEMTIHTSSRSSVGSELEAVRDEIESIGKLVGASAEREDPYPGWQPNLSSPILEKAKKVHMDLFGKEPEIKAIHAGLETGIIGEKYPGMDMISIGPLVKHPHSPDEKVKMDTCVHFWKFTCEILASVK